jgi:hypothetical protein
MRIFHCAVATVIASCLLQAGSVSAQGVATYSKEAMDDLATLLKKATKDGYSMQPGTTTIFGGWLKKGQAKGNEAWVPLITMQNLDPNKSYRVIAAGDNDTIDLDLRVLDPDGKVVAIDTTELRDAEVTFRPTRRQNYTIEMRLYNSKDNCMCIGAFLSK